MSELDLLVPALGRVLLHFLWQGVLIGLIAAVALHALRHARPQMRYAVACVAMLTCVVVPAISLAMQLWAGDASAATLAPGGAPSTALRMRFTEVAPLRSQLELALPWIVLAWSAGACALSLRMGVGLLWVQRLRATPQGAEHPRWQARVDALAARFGLSRRVALRVVDALDSPISAGWWRPVVFLPAGLLSRMPVELVEALIAHELAHIRRHDYLVNLLQNAAEALLFYHPVTWWLSRRIRIEREHIADRLAADVTGEPRRLAVALSELTGFAHTRCGATLHLAQAAHGGHLMSRIEQLVRPGQRMARGGVALPLVGLAAACLAFYAHAQIRQDGATQATAATKAQPATAATPAVKATPATAATPAAKPAPAAAPASKVRISTHKGDYDYDGYAVVSGERGRMTMDGSSDDFPDIERARSQSKGRDFVWFRRDGQSYVIADAGTVAQIREAWRDSDRIGAQMETLGSEMEVHGKKMEALGRQMEQLAPPPANTDAIEAASQRMEELSQQQAELAARQAEAAADMWRGDEAEQRKLSAKIDALGEQQETLGRKMEEQSKVIEAHSRHIEANSAPMEALGRQMEEAGKPMDALGKRMDALGKEQSKYAAEAERKTRTLIDDAVAKGLAVKLADYGTL
ncbi:M56 family metallopeptidase [Lysobacter panacisoli]|uniref:Peptidase M56 domain-containing protein n=1 Tax=Lysobacter panacisoli TaxID=1255263 RepID=A0ABP9LA29_9GAMM|nr:M56 family metallopeptidase [Lysobacter panacisoli]